MEKGSTYRRNGQLSSCEPCRISKLRCDHQRPVCARCIRRNKQCHYHPAPMSRGQAQKNGDPQSIQTPRPINESSMETESAKRLRANMALPTAPPIIVDTPVSMAAMSDHHGTREHPQTRDFDGATGLVEMQNTLSSFVGDYSGQSSRTHSVINRNGVAGPSDALAAADAFLDEGVSVLELVLDLKDSTDELVAQSFRDINNKFVNAPACHLAFAAMQRVFDRMSGDRSHETIYNLSKAIFEVSVQPLVFPACPANGEFVRYLSTPTVRWDTVGLWLGTLGLFMASDRCLDVRDNNFQFHKDQRKLMTLKAFHASMTCYSFGERLGQVNDFTLWHLVTVLTLSTWCYGDDSYGTWGILGTMSSVFFAMNLHKGSRNDSSHPDWAWELRKRAISQFHRIDKGQATFIGRPPRLSRHFCAVNIPLDISNEELLSTTEIFEAAVANLDADGWNRNGVLSNAFVDRVKSMIQQHRERVLELSLGPTVPDLEQRTSAILSDITSVWESIPNAELKDIESDLRSASSDEFIHFFWTRLDYLYTKFLCYKLLVNSGDGYRDGLIGTSHLILNSMLTAMRRRTWFIASRLDSEWAMVLYAMPCATILLLELSRRSQPGQQNEPGLNNSTIVKDISSMIWCCDWLVEQGQGNHQMLMSAQSIFSRGLDQILDNPGSSKPREKDGSAPDPPANVSNSSDQFGALAPFAEDPEWTAWLDTFGLDVDLWRDYANDAIDYDI